MREGQGRGRANRWEWDGDLFREGEGGDRRTNMVSGWRLPPLVPFVYLHLQISYAHPKGQFSAFPRASEQGPDLTELQQILQTALRYRIKLRFRIILRLRMNLGPKLHILPYFFGLFRPLFVR